MNSSSSQPILFIHTTKTAGGTLKQALLNDQNLKTQFIYNSEDIKKIKLDSNLIYGHYGYGLHQDLKMDNPIYMTFLRHPFNRVVSHYYHLKNVDKNSKIGKKIRTFDHINSFFAQINYWEFNNLQSRIISGVMNATVTSDSELFSLAKENIDRSFKFIGFQEFMFQSILKLNSLLDINIELNKNINIGKYEVSDIDSETINKISAMNTVDLKLYKYCFDLFM